MSLSTRLLNVLGIKAEGSLIRERKPYIAALLSACPGLGQQYAGYLFRGIILYVSTILISWIAAFTFMYVDSAYISLVMLTVPFIAVLLVMIDAILCARKQPSSYKIKWYNRPWLYLGVFAFLLITVNPLMDILIGKHVVRAYLVSSKSMYPSILRHDVVAIDKLASLARGDVVLIAHQQDEETDAMTDIMVNETIRRIIGMPGDKIEMRNQKVFVNDREIDESYVRKSAGLNQSDLNHNEFTWGPDTVPENEYFVLSDDRKYTFDSRVFGFISRDKILGIATKVFWSWNLESGEIRWERTAMNVL